MPSGPAVQESAGMTSPPSRKSLPSQEYLASKGEPEFNDGLLSSNGIIATDEDELDSELELTTEEELSEDELSEDELLFFGVPQPTNKAEANATPQMVVILFIVFHLADNDGRVQICRNDTSDKTVILSRGCLAGSINFQRKVDFAVVHFLCADPV